MGVQVRQGLLVPDPQFFGDTGVKLIEKYRQGAEALGSGAYGTYDSDQPCFYCGKALSGEAILYWRGPSPEPAKAQSPADLFLHPGCFLEMATRLFRDLHAVECVMDYRVLRGRITAPALSAEARQ